MNYYYHDYSRERPYAHYNRRHSVNGSSWDPSVTNSISSGMIYPNDQFEPEKKRSWCLLVFGSLLFLAAGGAMGIGAYMATLEEGDEPKLYYIAAIVGGSVGIIGGGVALKAGYNLRSRPTLIGSTALNFMAFLGGGACLGTTAYAIIQYHEDCNCPQSKKYEWDQIFEVFDATDTCEDKCYKDYLLFLGIASVLGMVSAIIAFMIFLGSGCGICCGVGETDGEGDPGDPGPTMINAPRSNGYY